MPEKESDAAVCCSRNKVRALSSAFRSLASSLSPSLTAGRSRPPPSPRPHPPGGAKVVFPSPARAGGKSNRAGGREKYTSFFPKPREIGGQTTTQLTYFDFAKGKQHCSPDSFAERGETCGASKSALGHLGRRSLPSHPPQQPPPGTVRSFFFFFFFCREEPGGTLQAPTRGARATLGAGVNQSPERRGAAARARAGGRAGRGGGGESGGPEEIGRGRERKAETEEREAAEGLVQARPLRGDQEAGAALDNQHAEMVRSFHPPLLFILDFVGQEPRARAPPGPPGGRVTLQGSGGRCRGAVRGAGRRGAP